MKLNKLLEKQIEEIFPRGLPGDEAFQLFVGVINDSYNAYEKNMEQAQQSLKKAGDELKQKGGLISELKDAATETRFRSIIANMHLGLLEVDADERIIYANNSFCEMSGYELHELTGKNAPAVLRPGTGVSPEEDIVTKSKDGSSDAFEITVKNKRGEIKWWLVSGAPSYDDNGVFKGSIGIHLDITVQKNLEHELRTAKSGAEQSAHAKEIFLANMSHEMRTPMNAILGIGRLLSKSKLTGQQTFYLNTIQNSANSLLIIINDLLDFSKIEAGKITFEYIGFDLNSVVRNAVQILQHKAEEKGLSVTYNSPAGLAPVLIGDPYRINQVLINLLSNALKFTDNGTVAIGCSILFADEYYQHIRFKITDTGIGMSKDFLVQLFDKFSQEDESITRKFGGTGLGMSISKQLIELMGGTIQVESEKNIGTTIAFSIKFPVGKADDLPKIQHTNIDTQILKGKRILLVEDNKLNRVLANTILSQYGAEVTEAADGNIAIAQFENNVFDLVLMDVQMPIKDGIETTRYIRSHIDKGIPIIALTANAYKKEEERCVEAGMNDFISKPYDEGKIVQMVAQWLGRETNVTATEYRDKNEKLFDLGKLKAIGRGDHEFVDKMVELFIESVPETLQQMDEAWNLSDWNTLAALAHRLKASIDTMCIKTVDKDIEVLEDTATGNYEPVFTLKHLTHLAQVMTEVVIRIQGN